MLLGGTVLEAVQITTVCRWRDLAKAATTYVSCQSIKYLSLAPLIAHRHNPRPMRSVIMGDGSLCHCSLYLNWVRLWWQLCSFLWWSVFTITEGVLALTVAKFRTRSPLSHVNAAEHVLTIVVGFGLKKDSVLYVFYRDGKSRLRAPRRTRLMIIYRIHIFPGFVW